MLAPIIAELSLFTRDSKGKIRIFTITLTEYNHPGKPKYEIERFTGIYEGKMLEQPLITITEGKSTRTAKEQAFLEFSSKIKKQLDKGYKEVRGYDKFMAYDKLDKLVDTVKTDATGQRKPMLAKDPKAGSKPKEHAFFNGKDWFISPKLDGLRCKGVLNSDKTAIDYYSRTGKQYTGSTTNFQSQILIDFMKKYDCEIDGEIYVHGAPLNQISGDVRKEDYDPARHDYLKYYVFDCPVDNVPADVRFKRLEALESELLKAGEKNVIVVKHQPVNDYDEIMSIHNDYIADGYEGAMVQEAKGNYEFSKRSSTIWKIKLFQDDEFVITGHKLGLRGAEDMCFILKTKEDKSFEAKPQGDLKTKEDYVDNMDNLIGKKGTVKFFNYTVNGVPNLPSFKCVRLDV